MLQPFMPNAQPLVSSICSHLIMYLVANFNKGTSRTFVPHTEEDNQTVFSSLNNPHSVQNVFICSSSNNIRPFQVIHQTKSGRSNVHHAQNKVTHCKSVCQETREIFFRNSLCPKTPEFSATLSKVLSRSSRFRS